MEHDEEWLCGGSWESLKAQTLYAVKVKRGIARPGILMVVRDDPELRSIHAVSVYVASDGTSLASQPVGGIVRADMHVEVAGGGAELTRKYDEARDEMLANHRLNGEPSGKREHTRLRPRTRR